MGGGDNQNTRGVLGEGGQERGGDYVGEMEG